MRPRATTYVHGRELQPTNQPVGVRVAFFVHVLIFLSLFPATALPRLCGGARVYARQKGLVCRPEGGNRSLQKRKQKGNTTNPRPSKFPTAAENSAFSKRYIKKGERCTPPAEKLNRLPLGKRQNRAVKHGHSGKQEREPFVIFSGRALLAHRHRNPSPAQPRLRVVCIKPQRLLEGRLRLCPPSEARSFWCKEARERRGARLNFDRSSKGVSIFAFVFSALEELTYAYLGGTTTPVVNTSKFCPSQVSA